MDPMPTTQPKLNDIVVFTPPENYIGQNKEDLVKRIVGVGGDTIAVKNGKLKRNGQMVDEPFIKEPVAGHFDELRVPEGKLPQ